MFTVLLTFAHFTQFYSILVIFYSILLTFRAHFFSISRILLTFCVQFYSLCSFYSILRNLSHFLLNLFTFRAHFYSISRILLTFCAQFYSVLLILTRSTWFNLV